MTMPMSLWLWVQLHSPPMTVNIKIIIPTKCAHAYNYTTRMACAYGPHSVRQWPDDLPFRVDFIGAKWCYCIYHLSVSLQGTVPHLYITLFWRNVTRLTMPTPGARRATYAHDAVMTKVAIPSALWARRWVDPLAQRGASALYVSPEGCWHCRTAYTCPHLTRP